MRPIDAVRIVCPNARQSYLTAIEQGDGLFQAHQITTPLRLAHFLGQITHESGRLTIEWESGSYSAQRLYEVFGEGHHSAALTQSECDQLAYKPQAIFERVYGIGNPTKARELGNTRPGDGYRFRGGGLMQTTGGANYKRMGDKIGVDLYGHPDYVLSAEHALKPALIEWTENKLNDYADRDDVLSISRAINIGHVNTTKVPNGLADRQNYVRRYKQVIDSVELHPVPAKWPSEQIPTAPVPPQPQPPASQPTTPQTTWQRLMAAVAQIFRRSG